MSDILQTEDWLWKRYKSNEVITHEDYEKLPLKVRGTFFPTIDEKEATHEVVKREGSNEWIVSPFSILTSKKLIGALKGEDGPVYENN